MLTNTFIFYTPVILWAQAVPLLGMLMIPKTCACLGVAWIAYRALYPERQVTVSQAQPAV